MKEFKRNIYENPPIQEAIVEAKFHYDAFESTIPGQFFELVKEKYPQKKDLNLITLVLGSTGTPIRTPSLPPQAPVMQVWNSDLSELLQIGPGITIANQLKYTTWNDFTPAIMLALKSYIEIAKPKALTRIGTRYINRFLINEVEEDLSKYFTLGLSVPTPMQNLHAFDLTFVNRIRSVNNKQGPEFEIRTKFATDALKSGEQGMAIILDIDCYIIGDQKTDPAYIVDVASQAHDTLEVIFESLLKEPIRKIMGVKRTT